MGDWTSKMLRRALGQLRTPPCSSQCLQCLKPLRLGLPPPLLPPAQVGVRAVAQPWQRPTDGQPPPAKVTQRQQQRLAARAAQQQLPAGLAGRPARPAPPLVVRGFLAPPLDHARTLLCGRRPLRARLAAVGGHHLRSLGPGSPPSRPDAVRPGVRCQCGTVVWCQAPWHPDRDVTTEQGPRRLA